MATTGDPAGVLLGENVPYREDYEGEVKVDVLVMGTDIVSRPRLESKIQSALIASD